MAGSGGGFKWDSGVLTTNLKNLSESLARMIVATVEYHATRGEAAMKLNAKWTDRTTNARNSLHTVTSHENTLGNKSRHTIVFAHGMPYGIWLEVRFAGRFAIIMPTVSSEGAELMKTLNNAVARLK